jgi:hypothetical protein
MLLKKAQKLKQEELDGFMMAQEFEELKNYDDYNFNDLRLVFPHPDDEMTQEYFQNKGRDYITFAEAEKICEATWNCAAAAVF